MKSGVTLEQAQKIVSLSADAYEIKDTIRLVEACLKSGTGITSINSGDNNRGFIAEPARIKAAQAMLIVLDGALQIVNAELVEAGYTP